MNHEFFEVEIYGRIHPVPKKEFGSSDQAKGKKGVQISVWESNIEAVKKLIADEGIVFISTTTKHLDFLHDDIFKNIIGIYINGEISDLTPLYNLKSLNYLELYNNKKGKLDFKHFPNLIELNCHFSKQYKNIETLKQLEYLVLTNYQESGFENFQNFVKLKELNIITSKCESLEGLSDLIELRKLEIDDCKKLKSLKGIGNNNYQLKEIYIRDSRNIEDYSVINELQNLETILVDGQTYIEVDNLAFDPVEDMVTTLSYFETDEVFVEWLVTELRKFEKNVNSDNWKEKVKTLIRLINKKDAKEEHIYTEEREAIIQAIEYILKNVDAEELDTLIEEHREW